MIFCRSSGALSAGDNHCFFKDFADNKLLYIIFIKSALWQEVRGALSVITFLKLTRDTPLRLFARNQRSSLADDERCFCQVIGYSFAGD